MTHPISALPTAQRSTSRYISENGLRNSELRRTKGLRLFGTVRFIAAISYLVFFRVINRRLKLSKRLNESDSNLGVLVGLLGDRLCIRRICIL